MKNIIYIHVVICGMIAMFLFAGCDKSEDVPPQPEEKVTLLISLPKEALGTRSIGDPGTAVEEGADWDQLAVILAYTDDSNIPSSYNPKVLVKTISKTDFENLPSVDENGNVKLVSVDAWAGTVHIYGVTYSGEAGRDLVSAIKHAKIDADVKALTISNDYASDTSGSTSKFVSVATGFYKGDDGTLANFEIQQGGAGTVGSIPRMSLKRLAAKIDIQWDAADAYPNYTDVKVTGFTFDGGASVTGSGSGRLFPELNASSTNKLMGNKTFVNTSEISQRNGRVYHYVFPDGVSTPKVTFNISANDNGGNDSKDYSLNFSKTLSPATWYKVNATIKGVTGDGSIDVFNVNDSGQ